MAYLVHSPSGTTWSKKNHKYVSKEKTASGAINYVYRGVTNAYKDVTSENEFVTNDNNYDDSLQKNSQNVVIMRSGILTIEKMRILKVQPPLYLLMLKTRLLLQK